MLGASMSIGAKIIQIRNQKQMSQRQLSQRSGIASSYLSRIENRRIEPQPKTLRRIAQALGVPVTDLFEEPLQPIEGTRCAVSVSGQCIMDMIHSGREKTPPGMEAYSAHQLQLLRMSAYLVQTANPRSLGAFEVLLESLLSSHSTPGSPSRQPTGKCQ